MKQVAYNDNNDRVTVVHKEPQGSYNKKKNKRGRPMKKGNNNKDYQKSKSRQKSKKKSNRNYYK